MKNISASNDPQQQVHDSNEQLSKAAKLIGAGRELGLDDGETIQLKAETTARQMQRDAYERDKTFESLKGEEREAYLADLKRQMAAAGVLDMDESDIKSDSEVMRDVGEDFGYSDYAEYEQAQSQGREIGRLYENLQNAKDSLKRETKKRKPNARKVEFLQNKVAQLTDRAKDFGFGMMEFAQEGEPTGEDRDILLERERARRMSIGGKSELTSRGRVIQSVQDLPVQVNGGLRNTTLSQLRDEENQRQRYRDFLEGKAAAVDVDRRFRGDLTDIEIEGQARRAAMALQNPDAPFKAMVQPEGPVGTDTPGIMDISRMERKVIVPGDPSRGNDRGRSAVIGLTYPAAEEGVTWRYEQVPGSNVPNKVLIQPEIEESPTSRARLVPVRNSPGVNTVTPESAAEQVRSELRRKRERGIMGGVDRKRRENAIAYIDKNVMKGAPQRVVELQPNRGAMGPIVSHSFGKPKAPIFGGQLTGLGKALGVGADMGVKLGNQRLEYGKAYRVERPDGSFEYVDDRGELLGDLSYNSRPMAQEASSAELANAPIGGETAEGFIKRLQYDNYGAVSFGDEGVVGNLAEVGKSGGGIPQVDISGSLGGLEASVAKELGLETPKGIRSAASLQAAADAIVQQGKAKGTNFFNMVDGKKTIVENPGMQEVFWKLKIAPAQQAAIANALYQLEASRRQNVDLDRKEGYFGGGRFAPTDEAGSQYANLKVRFGEDNPGRGGDATKIAKAPMPVQAKFRKSLQGDAAKPFVGQVEGSPARVGDIQKYQGMDPVQVREFMEGRFRQQAEKEQAQAAKKGKRFISADDRISNIRKIRAMQEGNVIADLRGQQMEAESTAQSRNQMGTITPGTPVPPMLRRGPDAIVGNQGDGAGPIFAQVRPTQMGDIRNQVARRGTTELLPRPRVKRGFGEAPTEQGPNIEIPADFKSRAEREDNVMKRTMRQLEDYRTNPRYQRGRRIAYGGAGSAAILAGILGTRNPEEEEQY